VQYFTIAPGRRAQPQLGGTHCGSRKRREKRGARKPPGDDGGFLWRMETWWRVEERDGGVYVQSEVASLTRRHSHGLGWLIKPFVTSIPKEDTHIYTGSDAQSSRDATSGALISRSATIQLRHFTYQ